MAKAVTARLAEVGATSTGPAVDFVCAFRQFLQGPTLRTPTAK
jgi:hypothetical protein